MYCLCGDEAVYGTRRDAQRQATVHDPGGERVILTRRQKLRKRQQISSYHLKLSWIPDAGQQLLCDDTGDTEMSIVGNELSEHAPRWLGGSPPRDPPIRGGEHAGIQQDHRAAL